MIYDPIPRTCYPCVKIEEDAYDWWARHERKVEQAAKGPYDVIFIGDSITHFWHDEEGVRPDNEPVWQEYYGHRRVLNLGYGFDRPQNVLWHLENGEFPAVPPRCVVLNVGTNCFSVTPRYSGDTPEIAFAGVETVVEKIFRLAPACQLILMEVFPRMPQELQDRIDALNTLLRKFAAPRKNVTLMSISDHLMTGGVFQAQYYCDGVCHPNPEGYRFWAEALEPLLLRFGIPQN